MWLNVMQCGRSRSTYALLVGVTVFPDSRNPIPLDSHVLLLYVNHVVSCGDISRNLRCVVYCLIMNSVNNNRGNFRYNNYSKWGRVRVPVKSASLTYFPFANTGL
jgi:hypothetical protein